ncbi:MAG: DUF1232 domain-containing protein [bacterium]|nr:DUF1232 domain-containing protein [bacterium]
MLENPFGLKLLNPLHFFRLLWHVPDFLKLFFRLFLDSRVPVYLKLFLIGIFLYIISPIDLVPDFLLPVIGGFDDLIALIVGLKIFLSCSPPEVVREQVIRIDREKKLKRAI